jgi:hypothetical protein
MTKKEVPSSTEPPSSVDRGLSTVNPKALSITELKSTLQALSGEL